MFDEYIAQTVFVYILVMTRVGVLFMLLPALGDQSIPTRIRVALAAVVSLVILPSAASSFGAIPNSVFDLFVMVIHEFLVGALIGSVLRIILAAVHTTGTVVAFQIGLAAAQNFDPSQGGQTALVAKVLTIVAVTLIFVTDMHHLMLAGMKLSYEYFQPSAPLSMENMAMLIVRTVTVSFELGIQIAAPFLVYALMFNLSLGLVARLVPSLPVFFVGLPLNMMLGLSLLAILLGSMMQVFISTFEASMLDIFGF